MSRPWMPLCLADYLADTAHLRALESGAYLHLIMHCWRRGSLPDNDRQLATIAKMTDVLGRLGGGQRGDRSVATMASAAGRLLRAYAAGVESLRRLKNGSSQLVRVEHVHVHAGGQAVVGMIETPGGGDRRKRDQGDE